MPRMQVSGGYSPPFVPPGQGTGLFVNGVTSSSMVLNWGVPNSGTYPIVAYNAYRSNSLGGPYPLFSAGLSGTSLNFTGLPAGTTYYFKIAAVDSGGNVGPLSDPVSGVTTISGKTWFPGWGMSSFNYTTLGNGGTSGGATQKQAEITLLRACPAVMGYWEGQYYWRSVWNTGVIDCSAAGCGIDLDYVQCVSGATNGVFTGYNNPRRMGIVILNSSFFHNDPSIEAVPNYILNDSTMGTGPSGSPYFGWWTCNGISNGSASVDASWRAAVMAKKIAFLQQLAAHVLPDGTTIGTSPYIVYVKMQGESGNPPANTSGVINDGTYSDAGYATQLANLAAGGSAAFLKTPAVLDFNYLQDSASCITLGAALKSNTCGNGTVDVFAAGYNAGTGTPENFGQAIHVGLLPPGGGPFGTWTAGGIDYRGVVPYFATTEGTEFATGGGVGPFAPSAIMSQAMNVIKANYFSVQYVTGDSITAANFLGSATSISQWNTNPAGFGGWLYLATQNPWPNLTYPTGPGW